MSTAATFPVGSIRRAVTDRGDLWSVPDSTSDITLQAMYETQRAERRDAEIVRRCSDTRIGVMAADRSTVWDPRVWIGVPLTERRA